MPKAIWNGVVLAESDNTKVVEGNHYFPADSINWEYFHENPRTSVCPWKGVASYYDVEVDGKSTEALPGPIGNHRPLPGKLKATWPSGEVLRSLKTMPQNQKVFWGACAVSLLDSMPEKETTHPELGGLFVF